MKEAHQMTIPSISTRIVAGGNQGADNAGRVAILLLAALTSALSVVLSSCDRTCDPGAVHIPRPTAPAIAGSLREVKAREYTKGPPIFSGGEAAHIASAAMNIHGQCVIMCTDPCRLMRVTPDGRLVNWVHLATGSTLGSPRSVQVSGTGQCAVERERGYDIYGADGQPVDRPDKVLDCPRPLLRLSPHNDDAALIGDSCVYVYGDDTFASGRSYSIACEGEYSVADAAWSGPHNLVILLIGALRGQERECPVMVIVLDTLSDAAPAVEYVAKHASLLWAIDAIDGGVVIRTLEGPWYALRRQGEVWTGMTIGFADHLAGVEMLRPRLDSDSSDVFKGRMSVWSFGTGDAYTLTWSP